MASKFFPDANLLLDFTLKRNGYSVFQFAEIITNKVLMTKQNSLSRIRLFTLQGIKHAKLTAATCSILRTC